MSQPVDNPVVEPQNQNDPVTDPTPTKLSYEQMETELRKVRSEAASRRVALREQEDAAKKWAEYEESQKTELQKLQDSVAERDKRLADKDLEISRRDIANEFNVAKEDWDLLVGDTENMKRLAQRLGKQDSSNESKRPVDLLAGNRGKPVGNTSNFNMDDFIRGTARRN